jgi:hypothetical protein
LSDGQGKGEVLGLEGERASRRRGAGLGLRWRRLGLFLGVTLLCGAFYLAGVWTGAGRMTCVYTDSGVIRCGQGDAPPAPVRTEQTKDGERA